MPDIKNKPELSPSFGELRPESNLPKGRQLFLVDEDHADRIIFLNYETDPEKFLAKENENIILAKLIAKVYKQYKEEQR